MMATRRILIALVFLASFVAGSVAALAQEAGPALKVDASADRHPIDPDIYGMAYADPALAKEIALPLERWGGDSTTRYNWKTDSTNAGDDWYFTAGDKENPTPSAGPDKMVTDAKTWGGRGMLTIPIIDYINKATAFDCSFPVSIFGPQQKVNPYVHPMVNGKQTDAGNGRTADGKFLPPLTKEQILRLHMPNTPAFQGEWVKHLVEKFGPTDKGGVAIYELDNEPGGWSNTHRDIHPGQTGHDELTSRSLLYGAAVKAADPTALVLGPGDFLMHYQPDGIPGDGKAEHGGLGQGTYYLQQMAAYEKKNGKRLLDYFDEHYYPTKQDGENDETRLESTRSLWDPTYKEKNWIGQWQGAIELLPKFHRWVDESYPGTKIGISEYGWGDMKGIVGALAEADVLGIFARERLDLACMFGPPKAAEAGANAFRIYRNYDGQGGQFGDTYVQSSSADQGKISVYAAQRTKDKTLTLVIINKATADLTSQVSLAGFQPAASAKVVRYSAANLAALVPQPDQPVKPDGFSAIFPARSMTLVAIPAGQ